MVIFQTDEDLNKKISKIKKSTGIKSTSELLRYLITSASEKVVDDKNGNENTVSNKDNEKSEISKGVNSE